MKTRCNMFRTVTLAIIAGAVAMGAVAESCLWKITSDDRTMYLQGSVHILKADSYPLDPAIEKAYAASDVLVLEVDMAKMAEPETQARILKAAMLPTGQTLQQQLDEDLFLRFEMACTNANLSVAAVQPFKPWFAAMTLTLRNMETMGFDPELGLDKYFHDKAAGDGKKVVGLETVDFQIKLFNTLAEENPNSLVSRSLEDLKELKEDMAGMDKAWRTGDIDSLDNLLSKSFEGHPDRYKTFVLDRNARWFRKLDTLLRKQSETHMVVVGAGHLPGEGGLLERFRKKGYTVEQL